MLGDHDPQNHSPSIPKLLGSVWVVAAKYIVRSSEDNLSHQVKNTACWMTSEISGRVRNFIVAMFQPAT